MKTENTKHYYNITVYTVEVPVRDHNKVKVIEARDKALENLIKYVVFKEV